MNFVGAAFAPKSGAEILQQPGFGSAFPTDAVACISRPARSVLSSGRAREKRWILRFERRSPPVIDPLMGWTGGADTLSQVELSFPSRESAVAYAERQGLAYRVEGDFDRLPTAAHRRVEELQPDLEKAFASLVLLSWMQVRYGCCDLQAEEAPALAFTTGFGKSGASAS